MARIVFLGHASLVVDMDGVRLVTDPLLRAHLPGLVHRHPVRDEALTEATDAVLISHLHRDHLDVKSVARFGRDIPVLMPPDCARVLERHRFTRVTELAEGQSCLFGGVRVTAVHARHVGYRAPFGPLGGCNGYLLEGSQRIYFAGDTDVFDEMEALAPLDVALLPVAGWGPRLGPGHMDARRAVDALRLLRPRLAVPIHWGSLVPLGLHVRTWKYLTQPPNDFATLARQHAPDVEVRILRPGEALELSPAVA